MGDKIKHHKVLKRRALKGKLMVDEIRKFRVDQGWTVDYRDVSATGVDLVAKIPENIKIRVLTKKPQGNFISVAKKFKAKPNVNFEARTSNDWHDRWVFVDTECWVTGQSVRDAGTKPTYLVKLNGYDILRNCFNEAWNRATTMV